MVQRKRDLKEAEIRTRYIMPALYDKGWTFQNIREEYSFLDGTIISNRKGNRARWKFADYLLIYKKACLAVIESKNNNKSLASGIKQAFSYSSVLLVPFAFSSNGDGFIKKNMYTGEEVFLDLSEFPTPNELWEESLKYLQKEKLSHFGSIKRLTYDYQQSVVNKIITSFVSKKNVAISMPTGSGRDFTTFQFIYRIRQAHSGKKILYLVDQYDLRAQIIKETFLPFFNKKFPLYGEYDPYSEIYVGLYTEWEKCENNIFFYQQFSPDFWDLIILSGRSRNHSQTYKIIDYFKKATKVLLTSYLTDADIQYFDKNIYHLTLQQIITEDPF